MARSISARLLLAILLLPRLSPLSAPVPSSLASLLPRNSLDTAAACSSRASSLPAATGNSPLHLEPAPTAASPAVARQQPIAARDPAATLFMVLIAATIPPQPVGTLSRVLTTTAIPQPVLPATPPERRLTRYPAARRCGRYAVYRPSKPWLSHKLPRQGEHRRHLPIGYRRCIPGSWW